MRISALSLNPMTTLAHALSLPPDFKFAEFCRVSPIDESSLWGLILERNAKWITVKNQESVLENLPKIFAATFRLANRAGFQAMTLRDLCRETGLSMGGLYGYLKSKDQLSAMIEDVIRYISEMLPEWFSAVADPLDRVESVLRGHIFLSELLQPWFFFVYLEARSLPATQRREAKASEQSIENQLAAMIAALGCLSARDGQLLAAHALAVVQDWHLKRWKYRAGKIAIDAFADSVVELVRARLRTG